MARFTSDARRRRVPSAPSRVVAESAVARVRARALADATKRASVARAPMPRVETAPCRARRAVVDEGIDRVVLCGNTREGGRTERGDCASARDSARTRWPTAVSPESVVPSTVAIDVAL